LEIGERAMLMARGVEELHAGRQKPQPAERGSRQTAGMLSHKAFSNFGKKSLAQMHIA